MSLLTIPSWVKPHLFEGKDFKDLDLNEISQLKKQLKRFKADKPEVSVVIPAWNEANNIYRTLSSLSVSSSERQVEIIVVNNNSTDQTQEVLETLGVRNFFQERQGTPFARQLGLESARGKYHLCADSDTFYPPEWIDLMVKPMEADEHITGVYGTYSFIPPKGQGRLGLFFYELFTFFIILMRRRNQEFMNVYGFNMGFVTQVGLSEGGFMVKGERVYNNVSGSDFVNEAEDGRMALNLQKKGKLFWVRKPNARVFTSPRRLMDDGSISKAFFKRVKRQLGFND